MPVSITKYHIHTQPKTEAKITKNCPDPIIMIVQKDKNVNSMLLQLSSPSAGRQIFFFINPFKSHFLFQRNITNNLYILSLHESSSGYTFFKSSKKSLQEPVVDRVNEIPIKKKDKGQYKSQAKKNHCLLFRFY